MDQRMILWNQLAKKVEALTICFNDLKQQQDDLMANQNRFWEILTAAGIIEIEDEKDGTSNSD